MPPIERDYKGNESKVLFSRLHHPEIKKQIYDLRFQLEKYWTEDGKEMNEKGEEVWPADEYAPTYEQLERQFDAQLEGIERSTDIRFGSEPWHTSEGGVAAFSIDPRTGKPFTTRQLSIIEAHEKGHIIRPYDGRQYDEYFLVGFDPSHVRISSEDLLIVKRGLVRKGQSPEDIDDQAAQDTILSYLFSGCEIVERMNQLKNYFGFTANELFTKEHLDIAREHYIADTGMDNGMTYFFQAITPEREEKFLELVNTSGI